MTQRKLIDICLEMPQSYRFTLSDGRVVYVDPYAGDGCDLPADVILVTHGHSGHNQIQLVTQKPSCRVITHEDAPAGGSC